MKRGFTLIEMIIVIVILAIIAAVAIPVLQNLAGNARNSATRGSLGAIRTAITTYRVSEAASNRPATWPAAGQVCDTVDNADGGCANPDTPKVMQNGEMPNNPWALVDASATKRLRADNVNSTALAKGSNCDVGGEFGWCYNAANGEVWANTANNGGLGGVTENNF